tara:strand:- start:71 stop:436 length:366 start_codon:yes stop_codon:yes gene_type:complete
MIADETNTGGRPRTKLTSEQIAEVETLAAVLNQEQICDYLGIPSRTFRAIMQRDEEVSAAYKKGRARAIGRVSQSLLRSATEGNTTAQIFYLKTQAGWKEAVPEAQELPPVVIQLSTDEAD